MKAMLARYTLWASTGGARRRRRALLVQRPLLHSARKWSRCTWGNLPGTGAHRGGHGAVSARASPVLASNALVNAAPPSTPPRSIPAGTSARRRPRAPNTLHR